MELSIMNPTIAISVVMPCYNAEKFISEAIESVICQDFTDFEFIIIDDGSMDHTIEVIQSYSDERIVLIKNKHASIISSLNTGLERAKGKYITRMDADDKMVPERLKMQYEHMETHPEITVCSSWMQLFNSSGLEKISKTVNGVIKNPLYELLNENIIAHPTVMIRRDFLEKHKLRRQLEAVTKWCNKLIEKNHKFKIFNEDILFNFLESKLLTVIKSNYMI
jgi:glycosyltransferase involved in cell wall biosynthesis